MVGGWFGAGDGGLGGAGAEAGDVGGGAPHVGGGAGEGGDEAEVAAEFGDEVGGGLGGDVVFEVGGVEAVLEFGAQGVDARRVAGGAVDGVFDFADDLFAGDDAGCGGLDFGFELDGQEHAAAGGSGGAVVAGGAVEAGDVGGLAGSEVVDDVDAGFDHVVEEERVAGGSAFDRVGGGDG